MKAVLQTKDSASGDILYMALELSNKKWKLGLSNGEKIRIKTIDAGDWDSVKEELDRARMKLGCSPGCRVVSCSEAGRDGFWIHRALLKNAKPCFYQKT